MVDYNPECLGQIRPDDQIIVYYPLDLKDVRSGCTGVSVKTMENAGYVALTEQRLIFKGSSINSTGESATSTLETSNVPLSKVSSVTTSKITTASKGCLSSKFTYYALLVNVQGHEYKLYLNTKDDSIGKDVVRSFLESSE